MADLYLFDGFNLLHAGPFADTRELVEIAKAIAPYQAVYISHERSEGRDPMWKNASDPTPSVDLLQAVKETIEFTRALHKPYAVVINSAPARRANRDSRVVTQARQNLAAINAPVWGGQISYRTNYSLALAEGEDADEYDGSSLAAIEIGTLWYAIEQSAQTINAMQGAAATAAARPNAA